MPLAGKKLTMTKFLEGLKRSADILAVLAAVAAANMLLTPQMGSATRLTVFA